MNIAKHDLVLPAPLMDPPGNDHIAVALENDLAFKAFYPDVSEKALEKYNRERAAFEFFMHERAGFVPELLDAGNTANIYWIAMRYAGIPLSLWLETASGEAIDGVLDQIIAIDSWLYRHQVNYLASSPKDILVDAAGKVHIIDFEYTFLGERFEQVLIERVYHDRLDALPSARIRVIEQAVHTRKGQSLKFLRRKIYSAILLRLKRSRYQKSVLA